MAYSCLLLLLAAVKWGLCDYYIPGGPQIYLQLTLSPSSASGLYLFSGGDASAGSDYYGYTDDPETATAFILDYLVSI